MTPAQRMVLIFGLLDALPENDPEGTSVLIDAAKHQVTELVADLARPVVETTGGEFGYILHPGDTVTIRNGFDYDCRVTGRIDHVLATPAWPGPKSADVKQDGDPAPTTPTYHPLVLDEVLFQWASKTDEQRRNEYHIRQWQGATAPCERGPNADLDMRPLFGGPAQILHEGLL